MDTNTEAGLRKNVLIVEDDPSLRGVLKEKFTMEGFTVYEAENGQTGLESALKNLPAVILLDLLMPKLDGMSMLKKLRSANDYGRGVRVIVLTNLDADDRMIQDVVTTQPTFYLIKSNVKLDEIVSKVKEVLSAP